MISLYKPHSDGRPQIMGIVNVTPDSFSDGGQYHSADQAFDHAMTLLDQGADWLDIGGESTRPGADPVPEDEEIGRVLPVIEAIHKARCEARISIDTMKPEVARLAISAGALLWNDVNALRAPGALQMAISLNCQVCLMHMRGNPRTMQQDPHYENVVDDVVLELKQNMKRAQAGGLDLDKLIIDPGIGFGKTLQHNLMLLSGLDQFTQLDRPVLVGASRKRFIEGIDPSAKNAQDRIGGSIFAALFAAQKGCSIIRVHDVRETVQALKLQAAVQQSTLNPAH